MAQRKWLLIAILAAIPEIAVAQNPPSPPYYAMDPRSPPNPSGNSPLQQQIIENYRTQLLQSQRTLSQQNPGGNSPAQLDVNHQLNQFNGAPTAAPSLMPPPVSPALANPALGR